MTDFDDDLEVQWSVWLTEPGGITVVTLEQEESGRAVVASIPGYDNEEQWARDYAANPPAGTLKAEVRCRTRSRWTAWERR